jgi:hypothetical protein
MIPVQKQNECWWFGETGKCNTFYVLMAFVSFCTVADIACLVLLVFLTDAETGTTESNSSDISERSCIESWNRCAVAAGFPLVKR